MSLQKKPWDLLHPQEYIELGQHDLISNLSLEVLVRLYQPIIGPLAYSLYMLIYALTSQKTSQLIKRRHSDMMDQLTMSKESYLRARFKLEALGLLDVFQRQAERSDQVQMRMLLRAPVTSHHFFRDSMLVTLLQSQVGEHRFNELLAEFSRHYTTDDQDWAQVTRDFSDVYRVPDYLKTISDKQEALLLMPSQSAFNQTGDFGFSWAKFKEIIQDSLVPERSLTREVKEQTISLHRIYGYDETSLAQLLKESLNLKTLEVDLADYRSQAIDFANDHFNAKPLTERSQYVNETEATAKAVDQAKWRNQGLSDADLQLCQVARQIPPVQFAGDIKRQQTGYLTSQEIKLIEHIVSQSKLAPAVINIMIHYYLVVSNYKNLNRQAMETTANDWGQHHIQEPEQALIYVRQFVAQAKQRKQIQKTRQQANQKAKQEPKPAWFDTHKQEKETRQQAGGPQQAAANQDAAQRMAEMIASLEEGDQE